MFYIFAIVYAPSQLYPENPSRQKHLYVSRASWQVAPFLQGFMGLHFDSAVEKIEKVYPCGLWFGIKNIPQRRKIIMRIIQIGIISKQAKFIMLSNLIDIISVNKKQQWAEN